MTRHPSTADLQRPKPIHVSRAFGESADQRVAAKRNVPSHKVFQELRHEMRWVDGDSVIEDRDGLRREI